MARRPLVHDDTCFACSGGADLSNQFHWHDTDQTLRSTTVFGPGCQGAPGLAHGGAVFTILDEAMGGACWMSGLKVMTGRASIHYKKPVPLGVAIQAVGRVVSVDGKKVRAHGELIGPLGVHAESEGTFILIEHHLWPVRLGDEVSDEP